MKIIVNAGHMMGQSYNDSSLVADLPMFENTEIEIDKLPQVDSITWLGLDEKFTRRKLADSAISFAFLVIGIIAFRVVLGATPADEDFSSILGRIWILPALVAFPLFAWPLISVPKKGYAVRDRDIIYKSGVFWRTVTAIPFNRIQHVEKSSTPLDRKFHLATLQVFTAGGSGGDLKIYGLNAKIAERLRTFILEKAGSSVEQS